jgi:hypothetical protein
MDPARNGGGITRESGRGGPSKLATTVLKSTTPGVRARPQEKSNAKLLVDTVYGPGAVANPKIEKELRGVVVEQVLGRVPVGNRIVSARLNPGLEFIKDAAAVPADVTEDELNSMFAELRIDSSGGKRHQKGGAMTYAEKLKYAKTVAMMVLYNTAWSAQEGGEAAAPYVKEYLKSRFITPLYPAGSRTATILIGLADQIVQSGVTVVNLTVSSGAYTANVVSKIIQKFNEWGTATSATLVSDEYALAAASAAVESGKQIGVTVAVAGFVANQIGVLSMSAVLAAILFTLRINLGSGPGRAYLVTSFYTWFLQQNKGDQKAIVDAAKKYATTAGEGAKEAARTLGPLLAKAGAGTAAAGSGAAQNAFAAIRAAVQATGVAVPTEPPTSAEVPAALEAAAPSAAQAVASPSVVVAAAEVAVPPAVRGRRAAAAPPLNPTAAPFPAPPGASGDAAMGTGGRRRKTKKVKSKRRVTRRKKTTKVLGAPVFIY